MSMHKSREAYDKYEMAMYGGNKDISHMVVLPDGYRRGKEEFFDMRNFASIPDSDKDDLCMIEFSQPSFLMCCLLIWTYSIIKDMREVTRGFNCLILSTPTITSMRD